MSKVKSLYSYPVKVRFYEVDLSATVFFTTHMKWFDSVAFPEFSYEAGMDWKELMEQNIDLAIAGLNFNYHAPIFLDDTVDIHIVDVEFGRTSMKLSGALYCRDTLIAEGYIAYVFVNYTTRESIEVPETLRKNIEEYKSKVSSN